MSESKKRFEEFNDGVVEIWLTDDNNNLSKRIRKLYFKERTVGYKRFLEANAQKVKIDRLIRVQQINDIDTSCKAVISGTVYNIFQNQKINDTFPKCSDLTLQFLRMKRADDGTA